MSELLCHNSQVLSTLEPGDMIELPRGAYSHWALYIGDEKVIHLTGDENDGINANYNSGHIFTVSGKNFDKACVKQDSFWDIILDSKVKKNNGKDRKMTPSSREEIIQRAFSKLGTIGYNVLWKNCEHFVSWCRYGEEWSEQATSFLKAAGAVLLGVGLGVVAVMTGSDKKGKSSTS